MRSQGRGILVVDDEGAIRRLLVQVLGALGYRIESVAEGSLALRILEDDPEIELVLTDLSMPGLKGRLVAEWVLRHRPDVMVVCMSGSPDDQDGWMTRLLERRLINFLAKPFLPTQVIRLVQRLLPSSFPIRISEALPTQG
jgi:CheY-like chemotaxis protein